MMVKIEQRRNGETPFTAAALDHPSRDHWSGAEQIASIAKRTLTRSPTTIIVAGLAVGIAIGWIVKR